MSDKPQLVFFSLPAFGHTFPVFGLLEEYSKSYDISVVTGKKQAGQYEQRGYKVITYPEIDDLYDFGETGPEILKDTLEKFDQLKKFSLEIARGCDYVVCDEWALWGVYAAADQEIPFDTYLCMYPPGVGFMLRPINNIKGYRRFLWKTMLMGKKLWKECLQYLRLAHVLRKANKRCVLVTKDLQIPMGKKYAYFEPTVLLGELVKKETIYVSLGTVYVNNPGLLQLLAEVFVELGHKTIMIVPVGYDVAVLPQSKNIAYETWVDQVAELARAKLFITHGGLGGAQGALKAGVPMIVIPLAIDQFMTAALLKDRFNAPVLDYKEVTKQELGAVIQKELLRESVKAA